jgi:phage-related baseplate assembly protein
VLNRAFFDTTRKSMHLAKYGIIYICVFLAGYISCMFVQTQGRHLPAKAVAADRDRKVSVLSISRDKPLPSGTATNSPGATDPNVVAYAELRAKVRTIMADSGASAAMAAYMANRELDKYFLVFHKLNLTREQVTKATNILAEIEMAPSVVMDLTNGPNDPVGRKVIQQYRAELTAELDAVLGPDQSQAFHSIAGDTEITDNAHQSVRTIEQQLSFSSDPLSPAQKDAIIQAYGNYGNASPTEALANIEKQLSPEAIAPLEQILTPVQIETYKNLLKQQEAMALSLTRHP